MKIRIVASRMMKAKDVRKQCKRLKTDLDQLKLMLDLQIDIRNKVRELKEGESSKEAA